MIRSNSSPFECQMQLKILNISGVGIKEYRGGEKLHGCSSVVGRTSGPGEVMGSLLEPEEKKTQEPSLWLLVGESPVLEGF